MLSKHATAFSVATNAMIKSSEDAYLVANDLNVRQQMQEAVYSYDYSGSVRPNPTQEFKPIYSPDQLKARITVLDGLKAYADSLVELTGRTNKADNDALHDAAAGVGQNLQGLSTSLNTAFPKVPALSTGQGSIIATAMKGLGDYLQARVIKKSLPKVTGDMDDKVKVLCQLLQDDVAVMKTEADSRYDNLLLDQAHFLDKYQLDPVEKRNQVEKIYVTMREKRSQDRLLDQLNTAVQTLQLTYHALAAAAQGNSPATLKQNIADLQSEGGRLAAFYSSLQAQQ